MPWWNSQRQMGGRRGLGVAAFQAAFFVVAGVGLATPAKGQFLSSQPSGPGLKLRGTVAREDGSPLTGATAYIYTARVRRGTSPY